MFDTALPPLSMPTTGLEPMNDSHVFFSKLTELRTELFDLAFQLECQGRLDAADTAVTISARIQQICSEIASPVDAGCWKVEDSTTRRAIPENPVSGRTI
jgi:hypothetical protein